MRKPDVIADGHPDLGEIGLRHHGAVTGAIAIGFAPCFRLADLHIKHVDFVIAGDNPAIRPDQKGPVGKPPVRVIRLEAQ